MNSELKGIDNPDTISQAGIALCTFLLIGMASLHFMIDSVFSITQEVPRMYKLNNYILSVVKGIISVTTSIGTNLLSSACLLS